MIKDRAIQHVQPGRVIAVDDVGALAELIGRCRAEGRAICDYGVGCGGIGQAPPVDHVQLDMPEGIIEHYRADMALRVHAATPIGQVRRTLADSGQLLPLDGVRDEQTVGEAVAHNLYGPLRLSYGSMRDLLLGLQCVDGTGRVIDAGGRTVKNVAGYDVTRLMVGSMNMLGVLTELTLRTYASPPGITQIAMKNFDPGLLDRHANALLTSDAAPWYLDWHGTAGGTGTLHIAYAGTTTGRNAHCRGLLAWLESIGYQFAGLDSTDMDVASDESVRMHRRDWMKSATALIKLIVQPGRTGEMIGRLAEFIPPDTTINALPVHGVLQIGGQWTTEQAQQILQQVQQCDAMWMWVRRPDDESSIAPIGPAQNDWSMLAKIKQTLDPDNILNPGRLPWADADAEPPENGTT